MYTQTNNIWSHTIMTGNDDAPSTISKAELSKRWKHINDYLWRWGCVVTSLSNMKSVYTPFTLNQELRENKGYKFLQEKEKCPIGQESFIVWDIAKKILDIKDIIFNYEGPLTNTSKTNYMIRSPFSIEDRILSGHYSMLIDVTHNNTPVYIDSATGLSRIDWSDNRNLYHITKIVFN
jgi:hypothetical protein